MKIHLVPLPPEIIVSQGIETAVSRRKDGYTLTALTHREMPEQGIKEHRVAYGLVEFETYNSEWLSGWILTISPSTPLAYAWRRLKSRPAR